MDGTYFGPPIAQAVEPLPRCTGTPRTPSWNTATSSRRAPSTPGIGAASRHLHLRMCSSLEIAPWVTSRKVRVLVGVSQPRRSLDIRETGASPSPTATPSIRSHASTPPQPDISRHGQRPRADRTSRGCEAPAGPGPASSCRTLRLYSALAACSRSPAPSTASRSAAFMALGHGTNSPTRSHARSTLS